MIALTTSTGTGTYRKTLYFLLFVLFVTGQVVSWSVENCVITAPTENTAPTHDTVPLCYRYYSSFFILPAAMSVSSIDRGTSSLQTADGYIILEGILPIMLPAIPTGIILSTPTMTNININSNILSNHCSFLPSCSAIRPFTTDSFGFYQSQLS
jgi:hypothetical protein